MEQKRNTPPHYAIRLDDLRAWHVIFATCAACGKRTHFDARLLQHGRPLFTRLLDLERKLRCSSCGNRRGNTLSVSMAPRN
jgi:ribosomal protein L37E